MVAVERADFPTFDAMVRCFLNATRRLVLPDYRRSRWYQSPGDARRQKVRQTIRRRRRTLAKQRP